MRKQMALGRGLMARSRSRKKSAAKPARRLRKQRAVAELPPAKPFAKSPLAKSPLAKSPLAKSPLAKSPLAKSPLAKSSTAESSRAKSPASKSPAEAPSGGATEASLVAYAHDIRTALTGILALSELLATSAIGERERRWASGIKGSAEHLSALTTLMIDAAKADGGTLKLRRRSVRSATAGHGAREFVVGARRDQGSRDRGGGCRRRAGQSPRRCGAAARGAGKSHR